MQAKRRARFDCDWMRGYWGRGDRWAGFLPDVQHSSCGSCGSSGWWKARTELWEKGMVGAADEGDIDSTLFHLWPRCSCCTTTSTITNMASGAQPPLCLPCCRCAARASEQQPCGGCCCDETAAPNNNSPWRHEHSPSYAFRTAVVGNRTQDPESLHSQCYRWATNTLSCDEATKMAMVVCWLTDADVVLWFVWKVEIDL